MSFASFPFIVLLSVSLWACESSDKSAARKKPFSENGKTGGSDDASSGNPSNGNENSTGNNGNSGGTGNTGDTDSAGNTGNTSQLDVVAVVGIGGENTSQGVAEGTAVKQVLAAVAKKYQGQDVKYALIASTTGAISKVKVSLDAADGFTAQNSKQLNFEMEPKDTLLGTIAAGCDPATSNLESTHSAGKIKVCNELIDVPEHSWTWGVNDLSGQLNSFLRKGAKRVYIFFNSNDATIVTASQFQNMAKTQNNNVAPKAFVFSPSEATGFCSSTTKAASSIEQIASGTGGKKYSFCKTDWSAFITDLTQSM